MQFSPEVLKFVDHAPGTEVVVAGKRMVRLASGEWVGRVTRDLIVD